MSGKNDGLRRKRTKYRSNEGYTRRAVQDNNFFIDYSNDKTWWACIERIAIAQSKIGVKDSMRCVESIVMDREQRREGYIFCSPQQLNAALRLMREIYLLKK